MDELKEMICRELDEIASKGEMSAGELDTIYKLVITKEKLLRIEELEDDLGYSYGIWNASGSYGMSQDKHYVKGHYSRANKNEDDSKDMMLKHIEKMLNEEELSNTQRNTLRKAMNILQR